jgi:outer membrane receptor protein involved in Fe transport
LVQWFFASSSIPLAISQSYSSVTAGTNACHQTETVMPPSTTSFLPALGLLLAGGTAAAVEPPAGSAPEAELEEIVVTAARSDGAEPTLLTQQLNQVPGTLGDALQSLFTLPGIVPSMEYGGQPAVRGSGPEDNTYLIDQLPAGFLFHDFGDSIVSEDLLRDFGVHTAGFGARYGNATGGLFDIRLREPRRQPLRTTAELSFLRAGLMVESGLGESQSFFASYRESLIGLAMRSQADAMEKDEDLRFNTYPQARD